LSSGITDLRKVFHTAHAYPGRLVELHFYRGELTGAPRALLGQELRWITRDEFAGMEFPPADAELIAGLMNAAF
jgi:hypothetical protein